MMSTINQNKASKYFIVKLPEIKEEINGLIAKRNFAGVLQAIVNHLKSLLQQSKIRLMAHIIRNVGWVHARGSLYIREIIGNLFVRSFEGLRKRCNITQWQHLYGKFPPAFRKMYLRQTKNNFIQIQ